MNQLPIRSSLLASVLFHSILGSLSPQPAVAQLTFESVAVTGDVVPGAGLGSEYLGAFHPIINSAGDVAFLSIFREELNADSTIGIIGPLGVVVARGDLVPGIDEGTDFQPVVASSLNDAGEVALGAFIFSPSELAILGPTDSGFGVIMRNGIPAPGVVDGAVFLSTSGGFPILKLNSAGEIAFGARLQTGTGSIVTEDNDSAVFGPTPSGLGVIAREGSPVPGVGDGSVFSEIYFAGGFNDSGEVLFEANLLTTTGAVESAIFGPTPSGLGVLVRQGDSAPGFTDETLLGSVAGGAFNNAGEIVFLADLTNGGINSGRAIFGPTPTGIGAIARTDSPAPGFDDGTEILFFRTVAVLNEAGKVSFAASIYDLNGNAPANSSQMDEALFGQTSMGLGVIAREGDPAPGATDGAVFSQLAEGHALNIAGDTLFEAQLRASETGGIVDETNDRGLFVFSHAFDELLPIVRTGDLFDINDDPSIEELKTVKWVQASLALGRTSGSRSAMNDAGQITFALVFTDDTSGVFIATLPVPEPSTTALATLALAAFGIRRTRLKHSL